MGLGPPYQAINTCPQVTGKLGLLYTTANELNRIIDTELPGHPSFKTQNLIIGEENLTLYYQDMIQCIRAIYGDPEFMEQLILAPECHCTDHEHNFRVYSKMHMGDWWWAVQVHKSFLRAVYTQTLNEGSLESCQQGATVIPIIISLDKTQLTQFCRKAAYPVYLAIGNIPREMCWKPSRHVQMLTGYLPITKLKGLANKAA